MLVVTLASGHLHQCYQPSWTGVKGQTQSTTHHSTQVLGDRVCDMLGANGLGMGLGCL